MGYFYFNIASMDLLTLLHFLENKVKWIGLFKFETYVSETSQIGLTLVAVKTEIYVSPM